MPHRLRLGRGPIGGLYWSPRGHRCLRHAGRFRGGEAGTPRPRGRRSLCGSACDGLAWAGQPQVCPAAPWLRRRPAALGDCRTPRKRGRSTALRFSAAAALPSIGRKRRADARRQASSREKFSPAVADRAPATAWPTGPDPPGPLFAGGRRWRPPGGSAALVTEAALRCACRSAVGCLGVPSSRARSGSNLPLNRLRAASRAQ